MSQGNGIPCMLMRGGTSKGAYFLADTHVQIDPTAEQIADMTIACASHVRRFGMEPKIALLSHSDFGAADSRSALKMREALACITERANDEIASPSPTDVQAMPASPLTCHIGLPPKPPSTSCSVP